MCLVLVCLAQSASSCGGVALAESVGGKFSDWFKILQGSKPMGDWHAALNTEQRDSVLYYFCL